MIGKRKKEGGEERKCREGEQSLPLQEESSINKMDLIEDSSNKAINHL